MSNNFISALEEQFNKDCKVINIRYEYEGYSGTERYIIASCLTEKEIWNKYPKQAKLYAPFVRVDLSFIEVRQKYINNEDKFCKRAKRTQDIFNFDETTAVFHKELLVNDFVLERINEEKECELLSTLYKSFDTLTEKQKSRVATVYKGNIIKNLIMDCQSYTKYRPNETTGGIFVSWRRKEELPTGA